jgi:hypothetical protein
VLESGAQDHRRRRPHRAHAPRAETNKPFSPELEEVTIPREVSPDQAPTPKDPPMATRVDRKAPADHETETVLDPGPAVPTDKSLPTK